jgi:hypothetical protein
MSGGPTASVAFNATWQGMRRSPMDVRLATAVDGTGDRAPTSRFVSGGVGVLTTKFGNINIGKED